MPAAGVEGELISTSPADPPASGEVPPTEHHARQGLHSLPHGAPTFFGQGYYRGAMQCLTTLFLLQCSTPQTR
jgi:hypothetical protein